ncbi:DUF262 domain-containing protein [candidate division WOR-3 bacterium]|nr:DUF262 domain-containing protein [candidate division WOR-3 bacterium]
MKTNKTILSVSHLCMNASWFKVNTTYQREANIWTLEDEKHLIDTILRGYDVPKIYLWKLGDKDYEVVDGQQRINTLRKFKSNKLSLKGDISGHKFDGLYYKDLREEYSRKFDEYQIDCVIIEEAEDEDIREIFRKLQRGKPLNWNEKLNAYPGNIVEVARELSGHQFFDALTMSTSRYRSLGIIGRFFLLEKFGPSDISPKYVENFFRKNQNMKKSDNLPKTVKKILNYLQKTFSEETPELNKESWIINIYLFISTLMKKYVINERQDSIKRFYLNLWSDIESIRRTGQGLPEKVKFVDANTSGTTSKQNVETRFNMMVEEFLKDNLDLKRLDPQRRFDYFERRAIWRRDNGICQWPGCEKSVSWDEFHADHKNPYINGGETKIENGQVLCSKHNLKKGASTKDIEIQS